MDWIEFCDRAMCAPDKVATDQEFAERYAAYARELISAAEVRRIREAWENRPPVAESPVISVRIPSGWLR